MVGTGSPLERLGDPSHAHGGLHRSAWVHLGHGRDEEQVDALGLGQGRITSEVPRVGVEILAGTELERVDEDRRHDHVVAGASCRHQRGVAGVEIAHGRHEADAVTGSPGGLQATPDLRDGGHHRHGHNRAASRARAS